MWFEIFDDTIIWKSASGQIEIYIFTKENSFFVKINIKRMTEL